MLICSWRFLVFYLRNLFISRPTFLQGIFIYTLNSDFDTIIVGTTATTANQTINHYGDRKLSDYKFITFAFGTSDTDIRGVVTIPRVLFSQIKKVCIYVAHGSNDDIISIVYFTYINDVSTSVRLSADHGVKYIKCLGVKQ